MNRIIKQAHEVWKRYGDFFGAKVNYGLAQLEEWKKDYYREKYPDGCPHCGRRLL